MFNVDDTYDELACPEIEKATCSTSACKKPNKAVHTSMVEENKYLTIPSSSKNKSEDVYDQISDNADNKADENACANVYDVADEPNAYTAVLADEKVDDDDYMQPVEKVAGAEYVLPDH